jgi:hypothetical protein
VGDAATLETRFPPWTHTHLVGLHAKVGVCFEQGLCARVCVIARHDGQRQQTAHSTSARRVLWGRACDGCV